MRLIILQVAGSNGATNVSYDIEISGTVPGDDLEANNSFVTASDLGQLNSAAVRALTVPAGDEDFFRFVPAQSGTYQFDLEFDPRLGEVEIQLYDDQQILQATSVREGWLIDDVLIRTFGYHHVDVVAGEPTSGVNFANRSILGAGGVGSEGKISGVFFDDHNGNRIQDDGEDFVGGVFVYLDYSKDGQHDLGEPSTTTDANTGRYEIPNLGPATYQVTFETTGRPASDVPGCGMS